MLNENGYQESIISKIFKRISNNHSLPQSQQLTQATDIKEEEIRMSMNLLYVEGTSGKLPGILRSHRIRSIFYTENTLHKLLCKPKDWVVTEDKNYIDCSNCESVYFGKSKPSLNCVQMNTKDLSGIAIMIRIQLLNTEERKLMIGKAG